MCYSLTLWGWGLFRALTSEFNPQDLCLWREGLSVASQQTCLDCQDHSDKVCFCLHFQCHYMWTIVSDSRIIRIGMLGLNSQNIFPRIKLDNVEILLFVCLFPGGIIQPVGGLPCTWPVQVPSLAFHMFFRFHQREA